MAKKLTLSQLKKQAEKLNSQIKKMEDKQNEEMMARINERRIIDCSGLNVQGAIEKIVAEMNNRIG